MHRTNPTIKHPGIALGRKPVCSCGHDKDYHIEGSLNCLIGMCPCSRYEGARAARA